MNFIVDFSSHLISQTVSHSYFVAGSEPKRLVLKRKVGSSCNQTKASSLIDKLQIEITPSGVSHKGNIICSKQEITRHNFQSYDSLRRGKWVPFIYGQDKYSEKGDLPSRLKAGMRLHRHTEKTCLYMHCTLC